MLWLPKLFGKRCIATIHGLDHQRAKWGKFASFYIKFGEKCAVKLADEIIVLSKNVQKYFMDVYGRKTVYIPNGVAKPQQASVDLINEEYKLHKDSYILFLGRLVPEKGITYLIEAFKKVHTNKKLVIAGGSSDTVEYEKQLQSMADDRIIFTGFVQGKMLEELYSNAYVYVLPSDLEGMPISLLEAMSYGNCCVVSNIVENASVVEDKGVTFEKGNVKSLEKELKNLLEDERIVHMLKKESRQFITAKYNWDEIVEKTLQLYEKKTEKLTAFSTAKGYEGESAFLGDNTVSFSTANGWASYWKMANGKLYYNNTVVME
jgi:glycosyltransferase involved in cell wall biosynthesis